MRKFQKQQILDVIQSLHMLHVEIKDSLNGQEYETAQAALADCQEAAIQIGEVIEQIEGTGTQAVSCLEKYCEDIYQISVQVQGISAQEAYESLESSIIKAENDVKHMPTRMEAVFLPYKASMWDSLESVWKAADEDPNCDAYVIPIPYYDKNPDGSFKEMHYEGDQYPKYVPVTNYEEYDFENRKPDMIYIHNPYDEANYVTSVHPGVFHADRVIVQSEDMRQIYIDVLIKTFREDSRHVWEQKILGLGSPKIDKVMNTTNEDLDIPEEWLDIIRKPDGSYKKIKTRLLYYGVRIR